MEDPFVVISLAKVSEVEEANREFQHLSQKETMKDTLEETIIGFYRKGYNKEQIADYIEEQYGQYYKKP